MAAIAMSAAVSLAHLPVDTPAGAAGLESGSSGGGQFNPGAKRLVPEGEKVEVPGSDGCFISITAWENESWLDPASPPGGRWPTQGKTLDTDQSKRDVAEIKRWLEVLLRQSADMRAKTTAACEASGVKHIQIAVVRDDPKTGTGMGFYWTPLVVIDMGDAEALAKNGKTEGTEHPTLETEARETVRSYLPVSLIVHEIEHMKRKRKQFSHTTEEGLAVADENKVAAELENFTAHKNPDGTTTPKLERTSYSPLVYTYRPVRDKPIAVRLSATGAGIVFERREEGQGADFTSLADDDERALDGVSSSQTVEAIDADLDGIAAAHDNCPHAWNPRQQDWNDDGSGDDCDPEITEELRVTDALVASAVDAVRQAASLAGGAPHVALIGPDPAGSIRFVRLAEVWPVADPFGIFRAPGIGDRMLDSWLRAAVSLRLALRVFGDPFGLLSVAGVGTGIHDPYGSAPTVPKVQAFAGRIGTFLPGAAFGGAIIIPVWVDAAPVAAHWRRLPAATAARQPLRLVAVHPRGLNGRAGGRPAARGAEGAPRQTSSPPRPSVKLFFVSTGQTTGPAFRMTAVNDGNVPVWLMLNTFALKPLANVTAADVERQLKPFAGRGRVTMDVDGYCLDFPKEPPPAGMVFGLADDTLQAQMDPIDRIAHTVVRLRERGRLEPDTDDPMEYAHDMVQWSIWTHREGFDESRFTKAFIEHVRKNFAAAGDKWTREMERGVAALAPARWQVIQRILRDTAASPRR